MYVRRIRLIGSAIALSVLTAFFPINILPLLSSSQALAQTQSDRKTEADRLRDEGQRLFKAQQFEAALESYQQALKIYQEIQDTEGELYVLGWLSTTHLRNRNFDRAIEYAEQRLARAQQLSSYENEIGSLKNLYGAYINQLDYGKAIEYAQQWLSLAQKFQDSQQEDHALMELSGVYSELGDRARANEYEAIVLARTRSNYSPSQAIEQSLQQLAVVREQQDRQGEAKILFRLGWLYRGSGNYTQAIDFYEQALKIARQIEDSQMQLEILVTLGESQVTEPQIVDYNKTIDYYQQLLILAQDTSNSHYQKMALNGLAVAYIGLNDYAKAAEYREQYLAIARENLDVSGEFSALSSLGAIYSWAKNYAKAMEYYQQLLVLARRENNYETELETLLHDLTRIYELQRDYASALATYQEVVVIAEARNDHRNQMTALNQISFLLIKQNQPQIAIAFLKKLVNIRESIRQDIKTLPQESQDSYTERVAHDYRRLADLLLQQDRVLEAQQVLDLLKVQELDDYLRDVRGNERTAQGVEMLPQERRILELYNQAIASSHELKQLRSIPYAELTAKQQQRLAELVAIEQEITVAWNEFIQIPEVATALQQLSRTTDEQNVKVQQFRNLQDNLQNLQQNAVMLYPLILENRLELVLVTPHSPPIRRTVAVGRTDLNKAIVAFRQALENPKSDAVTPAQQLYELLIQPLENDLKAANAETIIYAPDGALRYIPLAALHDGNQWLAQRFRINHITAASIDDLNLQPQPKLTALAAAFTKGSFSVALGDRELSFSGLPYAGTEVENLAATIPNTTKLLDGNFSRDATVAQMDSYSVVHLATHAAFVTGQPNESFILFGNGDRVTLNDVRAWTFRNVDLFVLSACETGVGGQLGDGREILGFGYLMEQAGARAAIASLWQVSDGGTQVLMNAFYAALNNGMTKAEALRQAQIALITKNLSAVGDPRGERAWIEVVSTRTGLPPEVSNNLSHPYYWAPFILIGNGL